MEVLVIDNYESPHSSGIHRLINALEGLGNRCEVKRFDEPLSLQQDQFDAIVLSGSGGLLNQEETIKQYQSEIEFVQEVLTPILGICFGHQLIGIAFGSRVIHTGALIKGFTPIIILEDKSSLEKRDPLFYSLPREIYVWEHHYEVVESLPKNFKVLAWSNDTAIEAMVHESQLIYGIQFHAEHYNSIHPDGKVVLQNFFDLLRK